MRAFKIFLTISIALHVLFMTIKIAPDTRKPEITPIEIIRQNNTPQPEVKEEVPQETPPEFTKEPEQKPIATPEHIIPDTPAPPEDVPVTTEPVPNLPEKETPGKTDGNDTPPKIVPVVPDINNPPPPMSLDEFLSEHNKRDTLPDRSIPDILNDFVDDTELPDGEEALSLNRFALKYDAYFYAFSRALYGVWKYPADAARRGESGIVRVNFSITKEGKITNVSLLESSGYPALDREVLRTLKSMPTVPLPPSSNLNIMHINGYFIYSLDGRYRVY